MTHFKLPKFYPILDTAAIAGSGLPVEQLANALLDTGIKILQYRHKSEWHQSHFDQAAALAKRCEEHGVLFVMNDRADYAQLLKAALHIGQDDLPPTAARKLMGDEVIGYSTHNRAQLHLADRQPVEYLSLGPIFDTSSKAKPDPTVGLERLHQWRSLTEKPVCAIGGITLANARAALEAGADSIAVISGLLPCARPTDKQLRQHIQTWLTACESP